MKKIKAFLPFVILLSLFASSQPVHADIAPPPAPQLGGLQPFQYQQTNVQMVYERVEMELQPFVEYDGEYTQNSNRIIVTAYFTMHNNGDKAESMQAIFPLESFSACIWQNEVSNSYAAYSINAGTFNVIIDGASVPVEKVVTEHPYKGIVKDPNRCDQMTWAGFNVTFPIDADVVIRVQYVMEPTGGDFMENIEYILETGAGWAGPIKRGYVVVKFPYIATTENVLSDTTSGYQFLYNEIFWSFENLEPTSDNNIQISIVTPNTWQKILSLRRSLKENSEIPKNWLSLIDIYQNISVWHGYNIRSGEYIQKADSAYEQAILSNPNNASLYSNYAQHKVSEWSPYLFSQLTNDEAQFVAKLLGNALALDPNDQTAKQVLADLETVAPFITFTPPATIPPTVISPFTATPSITPSPTITSTPTETPVVVTVIQTKLVYPPTSTLAPTETNTPTLIPAPTEVPAKPNTSSPFLGALLIFAVGAGSGWFISKRQKK